MAKENTNSDKQKGSEEAKKTPRFLIVGLGTSASGLEAFKQFFQNMPPDTGMAFIVVQHLDPIHKSMLSDIIRNYTKMKVLEIEDNLQVMPNTIYTIPPHKDPEKIPEYLVRHMRNLTARLNTKVIQDKSAGPAQYRMTVNDITGEKKTEVLLQLTQELENEKEKLRKSELSTMEAILQAQEKERSRIAADLHDGINPLLSMARLNIDTLRSQWESLSIPEKGKLDDIVSLLEIAMGEVRNLSANLSPALLNDFGLVKALEYLCKRFAASSGLKVEFRSHSAVEKISSKLELNLYRITQELLNNILKHADAGEVEVQLIHHSSSIVLMIEDDGVGFDQDFEILISNGFGFKNIAYRVKLLKGSMDIDSTPGKGTTITIELPL